MSGKVFMPSTSVIINSFSIFISIAAICISALVYYIIKRPDQQRSFDMIIEAQTILPKPVRLVDLSFNQSIEYGKTKSQTFFVFKESDGAVVQTAYVVKMQNGLYDLVTDDNVVGTSLEHLRIPGAKNVNDTTLTEFLIRTRADMSLATASVTANCNRRNYLHGLKQNCG